MDQQTKPLRLLALDGGGVRGYSELVILEQLMLGIRQHQKLPSTPKPCEVFDMICGTSTGGIIALMLGRLGMSIDDTRNVYNQVSKDVFGKPKNRKSTEGRYSATNLERILKAAIEKYGEAGPESKLIPENDGATQCKTFVCCQNARAMNSPRLFQSYQSFSAGQYLDLKIWEAARATSAAPTFFKRMKIGPPGAQEEFLDGGVGNNNPIRLLMKETPKAFYDQRAVACIISIGTGSTNITEFKEPGLFQKVVPTKLINALKEIATDCERVEKEVAQRFATTPGIYFRFNVEHGLERIPMESYNELGNIKSKTINYLQDDKIAHSMNEAVLALSNLSDNIKASELWYSFPSTRGRLLDTQLLEDKKAGEAFITSLDYGGRCDREDQIWNLQAHPQTVEWIWNSSFATWASSNEHLFWICGKPGSGKSTIMESIAKSDNLKDHLKEGLNERWTVVRHFFFDFGVSEDIRNNFEGFLRSLLYQLIGDLGKIQEGTLSGAKEDKGWSKRETQEKLGKVLEYRSGPVCILLDGLDEYQDDKWALVKFLQETAKPQIKLCIASRPDPVFDIAFKDVRQLKMQDENKPAIEKMVERTLQESVGSSGFYSDEQYVELAEEISEKANGVFLWAHFAVRELRAGWTMGDEFWKLHKRLEEIPVELEDIYARILRKIKPDKRQHAASMLQLVCYAKKLLTVPELSYALTQTDGEEDLPTTNTQAPPIQYSQGKYFERKILALTGGLLEIFRGYRHRMDLYPAFQTEQYDTSENESREHDYVNIIHRTVRTYLERGGWKYVLERAHEGTLHAEMLWLRVCARLFPPSFVFLPPDIDEEPIPERMKRNLMPNISSTFQTWDNTSQTLDNQHPKVPGPATSLRNYAALSMLDHARIVEKDLSLSSYAVLQPVLTDNFVCHHRYLGHKCHCECACFQDCPQPTHPLHLAIAHGLDRFVGEFLFHFSKTTAQDSPEWADVFCLDYTGAPDSQAFPFEHSIIPNRISLLEFALWHASKEYHDGSPMNEDSRAISQTQIVITLLEIYPRIQDAEMVYALRNSPTKIVKLLLAHWPDPDMEFDVDSMRHDHDFEEEIDFDCIADKFRQRTHTRPLWHIARRQRRRRYSDEHQNEELLDIFLKRGERINDQCGPVGTALHGNLLHLPLDNDSKELFWLLITNGADVNAHGPLGKPLELVWRLAHDHRWITESRWLVNQGIEWLIDCGAINEQQDPDGSVPSKDKMLAFCQRSRKDWEELRRRYREKVLQHPDSILTAPV